MPGNNTSPSSPSNNYFIPGVAGARAYSYADEVLLLGSLDYMQHLNCLDDLMLLHLDEFILSHCARFDCVAVK